MKPSLSVVLWLLVAGVSAGPVQGQTPSFFGAVVFQGKPVSGTTVWLRYYRGTTDLERDKLIETRSDAQGKFRLAGPKDGAGRAVELIARAGDGRIGWRRLDLGADSEDHEFKIELLPVGDARGRLTDTSGGPIRRARVRVELLNVGEGMGSNRARQHTIASELTRYFEATTKDDGRFVVPGIPLGANVYASVSAVGYGSPYISWDQGQPGEFRLEKAGRLRIRFKGADDLKKLAGLPLSVFVRVQRAASESSGFVNFYKEVKTTGAETLELDDVLPGEGELRFSSAPEVPYYATTLSKITIKPGAVTEVTLTVAPAARVRGRVVNHDTRQGVSAAGVIIQSQDKQGKHQASAWIKTGADGTFAAYIRPGRVIAHMNEMPSGYAGLVGKRGSEKHVAVAAGGEHTFPDFLLEPALPVGGIVVDEAGKPVPGVTVHSAASEPGMSVAHPRTDEKGRFVLKTLAASDVTALRVRTQRAVTDGGVPVDVAQLKGPVKLVVKEKLACRLSGHVLDGAGKPIAGATVRVFWRYQGVGRSARWGFGSFLETHRSDADGHFQTAALWPGDRYEAEVSADGYSKGQAVVPSGKAGQVQEVGPITLVRAGGTVRGVVVDSAGKPVAGVTVFNQGDAPRTLSTTASADGSFQLTGLLDGPFYVFARKAGYRFTMKRMEAAPPEARITLLRSDEPPPAAQQPVRSREHVAAERKLADYLIDKVLAMPEPATGGYRSDVFACLVQIDLARAKKWLATNLPAADVNSAYARAVRLADIERVAGDDADEVLTLVAPLQTRYAFPALLKLGSRFAKTDPARGLRFAEEAVVRARTMDPPDRATSLAEVGDLVIRLGRQGAGKKLLAEAALLADKLGTDELSNYRQAQVASYVAVHDLTRARALLKPLLKTESANRWLAMFAGRLAWRDSKTALAVVGEMKAGNSLIHPETRLKIARRVAERDAADAVRIIGGIDSAFYRAQGLAHVALIVAPRDRKLAWSLIDQSFAIYLDEGDAFRSWSNYGGRSVFAAWTAGQAQAVGYPDMASVVARVLACRPTELDAHSPARKLETLVRMAKVLALVDPAVARDMLDKVPSQIKLLGTASNGFERQDWLMARCLADPERAAAWVDEAINELNQQKKREFYQSGLMQLAEVLTAPPDQRVRTVMGLNSGVALRDEE